MKKKGAFTWVRGEDLGRGICAFCESEHESSCGVGILPLLHPESIA